jgi:surfeit locus 1 family protein
MSGRQLAFAIFMLALAACFTILSYWQVQRLHWKERLLADLDASMSAPPVPLSTADMAAIATSKDSTIQRVSASGTLNECQVVTLINQLRDGQRGEAYLAPLHTDKGIVYTSMGWSPTDDGRQTALDIVDCDTARKVSVTGLLTKPHWNDYMPEGEIAPKQWARPDVAAIAAKQELQDVQPVLLLSDDALVQGALPASQSVTRPRNAHLQYALFWGAMAALVLCLTAYMLTRRKAYLDQD